MTRLNGQSLHGQPSQQHGRGYRTQRGREERGRQHSAHTFSQPSYHRSMSQNRQPAFSGTNSMEPAGGFRVPFGSSSNGFQGGGRGGGGGANGGQRRMKRNSGATREYTIDIDRPVHSGIYRSAQPQARAQPQQSPAPLMFNYTSFAQPAARNDLVVEGKIAVKQEYDIEINTSSDEGIHLSPPKPKRVVSDYIPELPIFPLPPLPRILDANLEKKCFTHESLHLLREHAEQALAPPTGMGREKRKFNFEAPIDKPITHNESLEHVGDRKLGWLIANWIHEVRPRLSQGTATKLESNLVSNATLCHLSVQYSLPERLLGVPERQTATRLNAKVRANLFEAYIAAVYYSYPLERRWEGMAVLDKWLREVYSPLAHYFLTEQRALNRFVDGIISHGQGGVDATAFDAAARGKRGPVEELCKRQGWTTSMEVIKVAYDYPFKPGDDVARIKYYLDKTPDMFQATFEATRGGETVSATECRFKKITAETAAVFSVGQKLGFAAAHV